MELGAVLYGSGTEPILLVSRVQSLGERPALPSDLQGHLAALYSAAQSMEEVAAALEEAFRKHAGLVELLKRKGCEGYLSPERLKDWTRGILSDVLLYRRLSESYPTASAWKTASEDSLRELLSERREVARAVLDLVRSNISE